MIVVTARCVSPYYDLSKTMGLTGCAESAVEVGQRRGLDGPGNPTAGMVEREVVR